MREKIAQWLTEVRTGVTVTCGKDANFIHYPYSEEEETNQLLTLLREEIEKLENPYSEYLTDGVFRNHLGFEECRQKILSLLEDK